MARPLVHPEMVINVGAVTMAVAFHQPRGGSATVLTGDNEGRLSFWNLANGKCDLQVRVSDNPILWIIVCDDDHLLIRARMDDVRCFQRIPSLTSSASWKQIWASEESIFPRHAGFCRASHIRGQENEFFLAVPCLDANIKVATWQEDRPLLEQAELKCVPSTTNSGLVTAVKMISCKPSFLLASYESGDVILWDWSTCCTVSKLERVMSAPLSLDFDFKKERGLIAGTEDFIVSFGIDNSTASIQFLGKHTIPSRGLSQIGIRPSDRKIVVGACWDSTLRIFSWKHPEKPKPLGALKLHTDTVESFAFSDAPVMTLGNRNIIAAASKDKKISLWSIYN